MTCSTRARSSERGRDAPARNGRVQSPVVPRDCSIASTKRASSRLRRNVATCSAALAPTTTIGTPRSRLCGARPTPRAHCVDLETIRQTADADAESRSRSTICHGPNLGHGPNARESALVGEDRPLRLEQTILYSTGTGQTNVRLLSTSSHVRKCPLMSWT